MLARLQELGGTVIRPRALIGFEQDQFPGDACLDDGTRLPARYDFQHSRS